MQQLRDKIYGNGERSKRQVDKEHLQRLHDEFKILQQNKERKLEAFLNEIRGGDKQIKIHDPDVRKRLMQPRKGQEQPPARDDSGKKAISKEEGQHISKRLHEEYGRRQARLIERQQMQKEAQESEMKNLQQPKRVGEQTAKDIFNRLHGDEHRRHKEMVAADRQHRIEEEFQKELEAKKSKHPAKPETFYRLHLEQMHRNNSLAEKRRLAELQEEMMLKESSVHKSKEDVDVEEVFSRLYGKRPQSAERRFRKKTAGTTEEKAAPSSPQGEDRSKSPRGPQSFLAQFGQLGPGAAGAKSAADGAKPGKPGAAGSKPAAPGAEGAQDAKSKLEARIAFRSNAPAASPSNIPSPESAPVKSTIPPAPAAGGELAKKYLPHGDSDVKARNLTPSNANGSMAPPPSPQSPRLARSGAASKATPVSRLRTSSRGASARPETEVSEDEQY